MRGWQFSIGGLMGVVLATTLALAALKHPTPMWAGIIALFTGAILLFAIVGVACSRGRTRAWWLGFALFGGCYFCMSLGLWRRTPAWIWLPTTALAQHLPESNATAQAYPIGLSTLIDRTRLLELKPGDRGEEQRIGPEAVALAFRPGGSVWRTEVAISAAQKHPFYQIVHSLLALVFGTIGGALSFVFLGRSVRKNETPPLIAAPVEPPSAQSALRDCWRPIAMMTLGAIATTILGVIEIKTNQRIYLGLAGFVTCSLLGMTIIGTIGNRGPRRLIWLGAALFGWGFLGLVTHSNLVQVLYPSRLHVEHPIVAHVDELIRISDSTNTVDLARALPRINLVLDEDSPKRAQILATLERPIAINFAHLTPLDNALEQLREATRTPSLPHGLSFYVDPNALLQVEKTAKSPVKLVMEDVPLRLTLRLLLRQLDLDYYVFDGLVMIETRDNVLERTVALNDAQALGITTDVRVDIAQNVLALLAACLGMLIARLFAKNATA